MDSQEKSSEKQGTSDGQSGSQQVEPKPAKLIIKTFPASTSTTTESESVDFKTYNLRENRGEKRICVFTKMDEDQSIINYLDYFEEACKNQNLSDEEMVESLPSCLNSYHKDVFLMLTKGEKDNYENIKKRLSENLSNDRFKYLRLATSIEQFDDENIQHLAKRSKNLAKKACPYLSTSLQMNLAQYVLVKGLKKPLGQKYEKLEFKNPPNFEKTVQILRKIEKDYNKLKAKEQKENK